MTCLIKSAYTSELQQYAGILGSEAAAYYVLAMNNGYTLDKDLYGNQSQLFQDILSSKNSMSQAIMYKSQIYTPEFMKKYGDWTVSGIEPDINKIDMTNAVDDILGGNDYERLMGSLDESNHYVSRYCIKESVDIARQRYAEQEKAAANNNAPAKRTFLQQMAYIFTFGKYNHKKVLLPSQEELENVDKASRYLFDERVKSDSILRICNTIRDNSIPKLKRIADMLEDMHAKNNDMINRHLAVLYDIVHNTVRPTKEKIAIRSIVQLFNNEKLIKEGISIFGNEKKLVRALSQEYNFTKQNQIDYVRDFWARYTNEITKQFNETTATIDVTGGMVTNPRLANLLDLYFSIASVNDNKDQSAFDVMYNGLKSRLESVKRRRADNKDLIFQLSRQIKTLEQRNRKDLGDVYKTYVQCLQNAQADLQYVVDTLNKWRNEGFDKVESASLMYIKTDVIGYYANVMSQYLVHLRRDSNMSDEKIDDLLDMYNNVIKDQLVSTINSYNQYLRDYTRNYVTKYAYENVDIGDKDKFIATCMLWLDNNLVDGGIGDLEKFAGLAQNSKSPILRIMDSMLNDANMEVVRNCNTKGHKLQKMFNNLPRKILSKYNKLLPTNIQECLISLDDNGKPTGYWIEEVNKGLFISRLNKKKGKICDDLGIRKDEYNNPIFNFDNSADVDKWREYNLRLNDWLEDNCHRKYKAWYYAMRYKYLSPQAIEQLDAIESQIDLYYVKCRRDDGIRDLRLLSPEQQFKLKQLQQEKEDLYNPYIIETDPVTGKIISFVEKTGDALEISEQFMKLKAAVKGDIKMVPDYASYNKLLNEITDPTERDAFIKKFSDEMVIHGSFYERLIDASKSMPSFAGQLLNTRKQYAAIKTKQTTGFVMPNLLVLNDDAWKEIRRLEEAGSKTQRIAKGSSGEHIDEFAISIPVMVIDPATGLKMKAYDYFYQEAQKQMVHNPNAIAEFEERCRKNIYEYDDTTGTWNIVGTEPLSVFNMWVPNRKYEHMYIVHNQPNGLFSKLDTSCNAADPEYIDSDNNSMQPIKHKYRDERWFKYGLNDVNNPLRKFYDELRKTMSEVNSNYIPLGEQYNDGRLPQITDTKSKLMMRNGIKSVITDAVEANEKDEEMFSDYATRPDGTKVQGTPVRFHTMLKDPTKISTDILGSVIKYLEMGENFNQKKEILPVLEAFILQMQGGINGTNSGNQIDKAKSLVDMYGYGNMITYGRTGKKLTQSQKNLMKRVALGKNIGAMAMLSHNFYAAAKGFTTAFLNTGLEAIIGKYYNKTDYALACKACIESLPSSLSSLGKANTTSKVQAAMQAAGIAKSLSDTFGSTDYTTARRFLSEHCMMGEYTLGDYMTNGVILVSTYMSYKLIEDPRDGEYKFMNEDEYIFACTQVNSNQSTYNKAIRDFKTAYAIRLWDAMEITENGDFQPKAKYKNKVTKKLLNRIAGVTRERASIINGVVTDHGKPVFYQNFMARLCTVMRGYLFTMGGDKFKDGDDFVDEYQNSPGAPNTWEIKRHSKEYNGQYNFMTGRIERGQFRSITKFLLFLRDYMSNVGVLLKSITKSDRSQYIDNNKRYTVSRVDRKNITRFIVDFLAIASVCLATILTRLLKDEYPESWWASFLYTVNLGVIVELSTGYSPYTILDIFKSVSTLTSYFEQTSKLLNFAVGVSSSLFYLTTGAGAKSDYFTKEIDTGLYEGWNPWFRDMVKLMLKPTGVGNVIENLGLSPDPNSPLGVEITTKGLNSKARYYSKNVFPLNTPFVRTNPVDDNSDPYGFNVYKNMFDEYDSTFEQYDNQFKQYDSMFK